MAREVVIGRVAVKVMPDLKGFAAETLKGLKQIEKRLPPIKIDLELDDSSRAKLQAELKELTKEQDVSIAPTLDKSSTAKTKALLMAAFPSPQRVKIRASLDKKSVKAIAGQLVSQISGNAFIKNITKPLDTMIREMGTRTVPLFAALIMGLNGVAGAALAGGANLAVLSQDLARIAPIMLPLPGILAGFVVGLGATYAVFKDFGEQLPWVADELGRIQDLMSAKFWGAAKAPIEDMIRTLLPTFEAGLMNVTDALANFFGSFATSLSDALTKGGKLRRMMDFLAESINISAGFTDSFANIIANLGILGATYLPRLAQWFGDISEKFDNWLQRSLNSGDIFDWVDRGIENLKSLASATMSAMGVLNGLADAARAAGGSTIQDLARGLEDMNKAVSSPAFQSSLTNVLGASLEMMSEIANVAGPAMRQAIQNFADTADELLPSLGRSIGHLADLFLSAFNSPEFQTGFANFVGALETSLETLATHSGSLGEVLGGLKTVMAGVALGAGPLLGAALDTLAMIVTPLAETIGGLFLFGFTAMKGKFEEIQPLLPPIVDAFNNLLLKIQPLVEAALPVLRAVLESVMGILPGIIDAISFVVEKFTALYEVIAPILIPVLEFLIELLGGAIQGLLEGFGNMLEGITNIVTNVIDLVKNVFAGEWGAAWENVKGILDGVLQLIWGAIQVWWNGSIIAFFRGGLLRLLTLWKGGFTSILNVGKSMMTGIGNVIKGGWNLIKSIFTSVMNAIVAGVKGFFSSFRSTVSSGMGFAENAITLGWKIISSLFKSQAKIIEAVIRAFVNAIVKFFTSLGKDMGKAATAAWKLVKSAFSSGVNLVKSTVTKIPGIIKGIFSGAGSILSGAGKAIIDGLVGSISAGFDRVKGKLSALTDLLPSWKGPRSKDKVLLVDAGQLIIQSLIDGFESRFGDVRKSLGSLTDEIGGMQVDGPTVTAASVAARRSVMTAMANGESDGPSNHRTINYYAAAGNSLPEEDLFAALDRGRAWGF